MKQDEKFKNIEYVQVFKNSRQVLFIEGKDLENKSKLGLQEILGDKLGDDRFMCHIKPNGSDKTIHQVIRSVVKNNNKQVQSNTDNSFFVEQFNKMEALVNKTTELLGREKEENFKLRLEMLEKEKESSGIDLADILKTAFSLLKKQQPQPVLQDNISDSGMPAELNEMISRIDWSKVTPDKIELIKGYFEKFKNFIPLKES